MTASSVLSCFIAKTSQGCTHCAYFSKYSDLARIYHHKQAEYSCDRFVIFPSLRFHTSSAAPIANSLWELETRFPPPPFSPSLWFWVSSAKWIFHLSLQKWLGIGRGEGGILPALPLMSEYSLSGAASALLAAIKQTVSPRTPRDYARLCVSSLFADVQQHLAIVSPSPGALLYEDKCCVINFLKLHLLNYAEYHCDSSCISSPFKEKNLLLLLLVVVGEERYSWGRYCDCGGEAGRRKVGADSRGGESDGVRERRKEKWSVLSGWCHPRWRDVRGWKQPPAASNFTPPRHPPWHFKKINSVTQWLSSVTWGLVLSWCRGPNFLSPCIFVARLVFSVLC